MCEDAPSGAAGCLALRSEDSALRSLVVLKLPRRMTGENRGRFSRVAEFT